MSEMMSASNVVYLPAPITAIAPRRVASRQTALRAAFGRAWRRLRVSVADIQAVWTEREAAASIGFTEEMRVERLGRHARRAGRGPARIIPIAEARLRLRPTPTA